MPSHRASRRTVLRSAGLLCLVRAVPLAAAGETLQAAVDRFAGGAPVREGRVKVDIAPLVENGNAVPVALVVDSPMTPADHVVDLALFNEKNPERNVVVFHFTPRCGRAAASTRIRLATSQKLAAIARMSDGSLWSGTVDVIVTLAGCIEGS